MVSLTDVMNQLFKKDAPKKNKDGTFTIGLRKIKATGTQWSGDCQNYNIKTRRDGTKVAKANPHYQWMRRSLRPVTKWRRTVIVNEVAG